MIDGEKVKAKRIAIGLTQAEAAAQAGFNHFQQWSGIERGERRALRPETLLAVAHVLNCSMEDLLVTAARQPSVRQKARASRPARSGAKR